MSRILIVINSLNDSTSVSGVLLHYALMANEWIAMGHVADFVVAKAGWPQLAKLAPQSRRISSDSFFNADRYLHQTWRYFPAYFLRMASAHWLRLPVAYDVIYATGPIIFEVYPAWVLARRLRAKLVVKVQHMVSAQVGRQGFFDRLFVWTERLTVRLMNRHADLILCLTPIVAKDYHALESKLGLPPHETRAIGCGIDITGFKYIPDAPKEYDAVFLGRIAKHKGIYDLPLVWQQIVQRDPQAKLLVIGEGPHRLPAERLFHEKGLGNSVTFTGAIDEQKKYDLLARSRVGLSLSYEEGWGLSVTEFLAAGRPVVAYELPVFPYAFPGLLEMVPLGDVDAFAKRLLGLLDNPAQCQVMSEKGRAYVTRYDYRNIARQELEAIQSILDRGPRSGSIVESRTG